MKLPRRQFLTAVPAGLMVASVARKATADDFASLPSETDWRKVRQQFPMAEELVYFNAGGLGPVPQIALDKVCDTVRDLQHHTEHGHGLIEEVRPVMAKFLGVEPSEVAFTRNATEGNSTISSGLRLRACDEVIIDSHAHQRQAGSLGRCPANRRRSVREYEMGDSHGSRPGPDGSPF